jgi:hypothetical protein
LLVPALIAGLPLLSWAQGSTPPAQGTTITLPSSAAAKDSAMKAAPAAAAHKVPTLSDSSRTALKSQIERELKAMSDTLKLSPEQKAKARPILLDHAYQVKQLRAKYAAQEKTPAVTDEMKKEMQTLRDATDGKLAQVLTGEQMAGYKKWRDEGLSRMRSKMGMTPPSAPAMAAPAAPAAGTPAPADTTKKK